MKTHFLNLKLALSTSLIVLSIAIPVNYRLKSTAGTGVSHVTDWAPLPPPPPPNGGIIEVADGVPLPPPITPPPKSVVV